MTSISAPNADHGTVAGFGDEWSRFDYSDLPEAIRERMFADYFGIFPQDRLNKDARGADFGVGSGRWAVLVAPRVKELICLDASEEALNVAKRNLASESNCRFIHASVQNSGIEQESLDFAYSLGVLHHIPDTREGLRACVKTLKRGAPFLLYLYYRFDNKPRWYAWLWKASELIRSAVSRLPHGPRYLISQALALFCYLPVSRVARLAERLGARVDDFPLAWYRDKPFYVLRNDALDRFGTALERRFTRSEIEEMMVSCGLRDVRFSSSVPHWVAIGWKS